MAQDLRIRKVLSAAILVLLIVIYTFYRMHDTGGAAVSVGVDDSKIGIVADSGEAVFISLEDVERVDYAEEFLAEDYPGCVWYASEKTGAYVIVTTPDMAYVINASTKNATKNIYKDIADAISK